MDLHSTRTILEDALILLPEPANCLVDYFRGLVGQLAVIHMEANSHLFPLDSLVGNTPIVWVELEPMLGETLHELLVVE